MSPHKALPCSQAVAALHQHRERRPRRQSRVEFGCPHARLRSFIRSLPSGRNWALPKVLAMAAFPDSIRQLGSIDLASTALGEATHKGLKKAAKLSNGHEATHMAQVSRPI